MASARARPSSQPVPRRRSLAARVLWALWALVDGALVAVVAAGLMAAHVPSGPFWWAQLAAVGLPYTVGALAVATLVPLVARRRAWVLVHALLLAVVVWRSVPGSFAAPAPLGAPGPDDLVVMTFNLPTAGPSREALGDSAVAFVRKMAPDVLLMQDAWAYQPTSGPPVQQSVQVAAVEGRLPYRLVLPAMAAGAEGTGVPVLVRRERGVTVVEQEDVQLGQDHDASLAIRTHLRWRGRDFVLYNVHLRSFGEMKPWDDPSVGLGRPASWLPYLRQYRGVYARRGRETELLAERIRQETLPVVVAGDFNSTADNRTVQQIRTAGAVRADAFRAAGGLTWGRTYHASRPVVRIDFVLVDPALDVVGADVTDVGFSDHRPVRTHLRWAAPDTTAAPADSTEAR